MKKYNFFHILYLSFFSKKLYRQIGENGKGTGFLFLFCVLAGCLAVNMVSLHFEINNFITKEAPKIVNQIPVMTIAKGQLSTGIDHPVKIIYPDTGNTFVIIDTTGGITDIDKTDAFVLLTKKEVIFKSNEYEKRTILFSHFKTDFILTQSKINHWLEFIKKYAALLFYFIALLSTFLVRIIHLLLYSAVGMLIVKKMKRDLLYMSVLRISTVAITPAILINTLLNVLKIYNPFLGTFFLIATLYYLFFGIEACEKNEENKAKEIA